MNFLPRLAQHTSWEREIWLPRWFLDSIFLPPARPHVASSATSEEHRRPLSNHPVDARAKLASCSPVPAAAYEYPALTGHAHCARGCATGKRRQHLRNNERFSQILAQADAVNDKQPVHSVAHRPIICRKALPIVELYGGDRERISGSCRKMLLMDCLSSSDISE